MASIVRPIALLFILGLTACDAGSPANQAVTADPRSPVDDGRADCAIGPGAHWSRNCLIERGKDAAILILRHPDGGFRRLRIVTDGRGIVAADGSEAASVTIAGDSSIEVTVGQDRYRLPATVAASAR